MRRIRNPQLRPRLEGLRPAPRPGVYILPNLFTAASLFCGMLAIFDVFNGTEDQSLTDACWLIVAAAILDVFDGAVARLTRTQSAFGLEFDSLSDVVSFGVAPAVLVYAAAADAEPIVIGTVCALFAVLGAMRLARFNVQAQKEEKKSFTGLPIPGGALVVTSLVWFTEKHPILTGQLKDAGVPFGIILPLIVIIIGGLMVSKVPFFGFKSIRFAKRQPFEILVVVVLIACMLFMLRTHLDVVLFIGMWSYLLISLGSAALRRAPTPQPAVSTSTPSEPQ